MRRLAYENYQKADKQLQKWQKNKPTTEKQIIYLKEQLEQRKSDQEEILLERIRDKAHADVYTKMLEDCEKDIESLSQKIIAFLLSILVLRLKIISMFLKQYLSLAIS